MKLLRFFIFVILAVSLLPSSIAAEWQWSVQISGIVSNETNDHPQAFLWIPSDCVQVKGVMIGTHNMTEETLFENALFREKMSEIGLALIWITPGWDQKWDITAGSQKAFEQMLDDFASVSGYNELKYAPIVPFGHSAMATYPWNFAAWNPDRTLAIISLHGDAPRTNLTGYGRDNMEWGKRTIDGIPGLMIEGEYEWWEDRVNPALAFRMMYPKSCVSFLCDTGRGHFDIADRTAVAAAMADTDKYLLAHLVLLLRNSCPIFTLNADYAAHRSAVRTLFFRREQVAVRHAIHAGATACVLHEQQLDVVVIADVLRNFQLGVTGRSLHMDIPAVCQQAAHISAAPVRLAERSVHLAVLDRQLPTRNNIL